MYCFVWINGLENHCPIYKELYIQYQVQKLSIYKYKEFQYGVFSKCVLCTRLFWKFVT